MNQSTRRGGRALSLPHWEMMPQFRSLENLMGRLFDEGEEGWFGGAMIPSVDVSETDKTVDVRVDLPGMKAEEIDIQVHNNLLTIRGERQEESEERDRKFHRVERRTGTFSRTVSLPSEIDQDQIDAAYKDGVLTIAMPKAKAAQAKKISVKS